MEPLPPTVEAFEKLDRVGFPDAAAVLQRLGRRALAEVPECVGLSLTLVEDGITLTLVSSSLDVAQIDAMQYLDGGPCVAAVDDGLTVETHDLGLLDEDRWSLFSRSSAAAGVQSTLSLSISDGRSVVGGINLYAGVPNAFEGSRRRPREHVPCRCPVRRQGRGPRLLHPAVRGRGTADPGRPGRCAGRRRDDRCPAWRRPRRGRDPAHRGRRTSGNPAPAGGPGGDRRAHATVVDT